MFTDKQYKKWKSLSSKKNLSGEKALQAVKKYGDALQYVIDQTEEIVKAAVRENGHALQFVEERFFKKPSVKVIINGKSVKLSDESVEAIRRAIN